MTTDPESERVHRPRSRRAPFNAKAPQYPGEGCTGWSACAVCPRWRCTGCLYLRPWCFGCDGKHPSLCDGCAASKTIVARFVARVVRR